MQSITSDVQVCVACGTSKSATDEFFRLSRRTGRPLRKCRECDKADRKAWYGRNADACRAYAAEWKASNPERVKMHQEWRKPRRRVSAGFKQKPSWTGERRNAYMRDWYRKNPEKFLERNRNLRAKRYGAFDVHTQEEVERQFVIQGGKCFYCDLDFATEADERYTVDHFIPLSKGGSNAAINIVCACRHCNSRKHDYLPWDWLPERFVKPEGWE